MTRLPDQYLFVNKNATSGSLSNSKTEDSHFIQSHVQGKLRRRASPTLRPWEPETVQPGSPSSNSRQSRTPKSTDSDLAYIIKTNPEFEDAWSHQAAIRSSGFSPKGNSFDPFCVTPINVDPETHRLLLYPFMGFVETTFSAEALQLTRKRTPSGTIRHHTAITERLRRCFTDELTMYSTLSYSTSCLRWTIGKQERNRAPEIYVIKSIAKLRTRLQTSSSIDSWLILAIYSLSISEFWTSLPRAELETQNADAATTHMRVIRDLVVRLGGMTRLEPYVMENLLIGNKYIAIRENQAPILPLDWDPGSLHEDVVLKVKNEMDPELHHLGTALLEWNSDLVNPELLAIANDTVLCVQVAHFRGYPQTRTDLERWVFLRHQALMHRLLSTAMIQGLQECFRLALLAWLLKITPYFGSQRSLPIIMPRLRAALFQLPGTYTEGELALVFWIAGTGAIVAEDLEEEVFFVRETARYAALLRLATVKEFKKCLRRFFFLESLHMPQLERLIQKIGEYVGSPSTTDMTSDDSPCLESET